MAAEKTKATLNKDKKVTGTIAAQASAKGAAGISVVRVSGPKQRIFFRNNKKTPVDRNAAYTTFYGSNDKEIDNGGSIL